MLRLSLILIVLVACQTPKERRAAPKPPAAAQPASTPQATPAPNDGLIDIDGPGLLAELRKRERKAMLINVWASWCGSCKRELPMLVSLASALETEDVGVMFVSVDKADARPAAVALLDGMSPRPESFIAAGSLGLFKRALNPAWKGALPATMLYDGNGKLVYFWPGPILEHEITNVVSAFLAGQPLEGVGPTLMEPDPPPG